MTGTRKRYRIRLIAPRHVTFETMASASSIAKSTAWTLLVLAVLLALGYTWVGRRVPRLPLAKPLQEDATAWAESVRIPDEAWQVIQARAAAVTGVTSSPLAERYRLAGTFFLYASDGVSAESNRRAIIDDVQKSQQSMVRAGDKLDEFEVNGVFPDRVILRAAGVNYELALSFSGATPPPASSVAPTTSNTVVAMEDMPALETSRFGKRVGENRWVFKREELLKYYREVLDEPQRIAAIYMSLKPDYQENEIAGYRLGTEGEADFFKAVGLQENDAIRKVNSMRMVSQRRAEYFLSEFLKDRVNALVIDVERGGKPEKLIYLIR